MAGSSSDRGRYKNAAAGYAYATRKGDLVLMARIARRAEALAAAIAEDPRTRPQSRSAWVMNAREWHRRVLELEAGEEPERQGERL